MDTTSHIPTVAVSADAPVEEKSSGGPTSCSLEVILRACQGDLTAQGEVITAYQPRMAGFVYAMLGQGQAVDDLCQAIFVRMVLSLGNLRKPESFEPWLWRIAHNTCMSHLRKQKFTRLFVPFLLEDHDAPAPASLPSTEWEWFQQALQRLPEKERELIILLQEDLSYQEMAEISGSSVSSVKSRLFRAREQLKTWRQHELGK